MTIGRMKKQKMIKLFKKFLEKIKRKDKKCEYEWVKIAEIAIGGSCRFKNIDASKPILVWKYQKIEHKKEKSNENSK